jgi:hypothetical protein
MALRKSIKASSSLRLDSALELAFLRSSIKLKPRRPKSEPSADGRGFWVSSLRPWVNNVRSSALWPGFGDQDVQVDGFVMEPAAVALELGYEHHAQATVQLGGMPPPTPSGPSRLDVHGFELVEPSCRSRRPRPSRGRRHLVSLPSGFARDCQPVARRCAHRASPGPIM